MKQALYIVFILFSSLFSCYEQKNISTNSGVEKIKIDNKLDFKFNNTFNLRHCIQIETNSNSLISSIV